MAWVITSDKIQVAVLHIHGVVRIFTGMDLAVMHVHGGKEDGVRQAGAELEGCCMRFTAEFVQLKNNESIVGMNSGFLVQTSLGIENRGFSLCN